VETNKQPITAGREFTLKTDEFKPGDGVRLTPEQLEAQQKTAATVKAAAPAAKPDDGFSRADMDKMVQEGGKGQAQKALGEMQKGGGSIRRSCAQIRLRFQR